MYHKVEAVKEEIWESWESWDSQDSQDSRDLYFLNSNVLYFQENVFKVCLRKKPQEICQAVHMSCFRKWLVVLVSVTLFDSQVTVGNFMIISFAEKLKYFNITFKF